MVNLEEASAAYSNVSDTTTSNSQSNGTPAHEVTVLEDIGSPRQSKTVDLPEIANNRRTHECGFNCCCKCIYWRPKGCCYFKRPKGCLEWLIVSLGIIAFVIALGLIAFILYNLLLLSFYQHSVLEGN